MKICANKVLWTILICVLFLTMGMPLKASAEDFQKGDVVCFGHRPIFDYSNWVPSEVVEQLGGKSWGFYKVGNYTYFVDAEGDDVYCTIPIRWIVLEDDGTNLLLMSEYVFRGRAWDDEMDAASLSWENSDIRAFISGESYYKNYFSDEEYSEIVVSSIDTETYAGTVVTTNDKLYLPSVSELFSYYPEAVDRQARYYDWSEPDTVSTESSSFLCAYWTRDMLHANYGMPQPTYINSNGNGSYGGTVYVTWSNGMRPLLRLPKTSGNYYRAPQNVTATFASDRIEASTGYHLVPITFSGDYVTEQTEILTLYGYRGSTPDTPVLFEDGEKTLTAYIYGLSPEETSVSTTLVGIPVEPVELPSAVKYVLYETKPFVQNPAGVTYSITAGALPIGLTLREDGVITGIPMESGSFTLTISGSGAMVFSNEYTIYVGDNSDANVNGYADAGYELIERVPEIRSSENEGTHLLVSAGEFSKYRALYLDGDMLIPGADYTAESGSTRITIQSQTLSGAGDGDHTLALEFRDPVTDELFTAAQNYRVVTDNSDSSEDSSNDSSDSSSDSSSGDASSTPSEPGTGASGAAASAVTEGVYRLYNSHSGEHMYTLSASERDMLVKAGWTDEGYAWAVTGYSTKPVYRLCNPNTNDHHYTIDAQERDSLVQLGWRDEGIGWYSSEGGKAVYRLYNPNAHGIGAHHYTIDAAEKDALVEFGWQYEGIAWYAE